MRTLTTTLRIAQEVCDCEPRVKIEAQEFDKPSLANEGLGVTGLEMFKLYDGGTENSDGQLGVAIGNDGSLNRIYIGADNKLYHQRVADPTTESDYTSWTVIETGLTYNYAAIAANPAATEMIIACEKGIKTSTNNGATWGAWNDIDIDHFGKGMAMAYKPNGDCAIVGTAILDAAQYYIAIKKRVSGNWGSWHLFPTGEVAAHILSSIAMYFDTNWNVLYVKMVPPGVYYPTVSVFYDATDEWDENSTVVSFTDTKIITSEALQLNPVSWNVPDLVDTSPLLFSASMAGFLGTGHGMTHDQFRRTSMNLALLKQSERLGAYMAKKPVISTYQSVHPEIVTCSHAYIVKAYSGVIMSLFHNGNSFFYRLKPGTTFMDGLFSDAKVLANTAEDGMALAADDNWIYATQATEVWRVPSHVLWEPPSAGTGAGDYITINQGEIIDISEKVTDKGETFAVITIDNSEGQYANLGTGDLAPLNLGSRINIYMGYHTSEGDEYSESARYFVEEYRFFRDAGISRLALYCIDGWGLLNRYVFTATVEWNVHYNQYTIYEMIEMLIQAIGGTLDYDSRSDLITTLTPAISVSPGGNAADTLRQLLEYVPDTIRFFGTDATIVYPQAADEAVYSYEFTI